MTDVSTGDQVSTPVGGGADLTPDAPGIGGPGTGLPGPVQPMGELAAALAAALGYGWAASPGPSPDTNAFIRHGDGRGLFLATVTYGAARGRITIEGIYPGSWRPAGSDRCRITVSRTRPPQAVARDITRRLLPGYEPLLVRAREAVAGLQREAACRDQVAAAILTAVPGAQLCAVQPREHGIALTLRGHGYRHNVMVRSAVGGTEIDVDLRGVAATDGVRMLTALGAGDPDPPRPAGPGRPAC